MNDEQYDIVFRGDIVMGHQLTDVKARLQQLFKADAAKIDALFSGRPVPLKKNLDRASAEKYRDALQKAGALVQITLVADSKAAPVVVKPAAPSNASSVAPSEQSVDVKSGDTKAADVKKETAPLWSLAPVGVYLLTPAEIKRVAPRVINTSAYSLRPMGGNLIDAREQPAAPASSVAIPSLTLAAAGSDLVRADEKMELPFVEIELGDWTLADLGTDLITANEKAPEPPPVIASLDVGLAPVGADLGQIKPAVKPVVADISYLKLAD